MGSLSDYYYKQKYKKSCSAQSVAVLYNFIFEENIDEDYLFKIFPNWRTLTYKGIGLPKLEHYISKLFKTKPILIFNNSEYNKYSQQFKKEFNKYIKTSYVIIYYGPENKGHYSPILAYRNGKVKIGKSGTHNLIWVKITNLLGKVNGFIAF